MKKRALFLLFVGICSVILLAGCSKKNNAGLAVSPSNAVEALKARGVFVLGYDGNFPPMAYINSDNELAGYDIDLAKEVAKRMGVEFKARIIDWDDKEKELEKGTIDCVWDGFSVTNERRKLYSFTFPYLSNEQVILVRKTGAIKSLEDLSGRVVGYRSTSSSRDAIENNPSFKNMLSDMIAYKDNKSVLADLEVGALDAIVIDSIVANYYIAQTGEPLTIISKSLSLEQYCVGFRKNEEELKNEVEKILLEMSDDGTIAALTIKWFGKDVSLIK